MRLTWSSWQPTTSSGTRSSRWSRWVNRTCTTPPSSAPTTSSPTASPPTTPSNRMLTSSSCCTGTTTTTRSHRARGRRILSSPNTATAPPTPSPSPPSCTCPGSSTWPSCRTNWRVTPTARAKYRSCVTSTTVPVNARSASSTTSSESTSRKLVGSSSSSTSAPPLTIVASRSRRSSPADKVASGWSSWWVSKRYARRGRRCEGQAQHGTGLGLREPCGGLHLPALPRLGLARHLLGVPSLFVRAQPATDRAFDRLGLAPGAFDVLGEPGPRLLLRLEVQQQPLPAALFLDPVSGVVARVDQRFVVDAVELDDGGDHAVEERPVVRDDEQRAGEVGEVAAEPVEAGRVEVVRGFVEQEYRRLGEQHPGEHDPGLLTAGQGAETPAGIDPVDTQLCAYLVHPGGIRPPAELGEPVEVLGVGLLDGVGGIRLPGGLGGVGWLGGLGWLGGVGGFGEPEAAGKRGQLAWRARQVRADRGGRVGHLLGVVAERGGCVDGSLVRPQLAGQDAQQCRLAHAVRTDQADPVAPGQGQRHAPEQRLAVVGHRKIDSLKQGAHLRDIGWKDHRSCRGLPHRCLRSSGRGRCRGPCCRGRCISPTGLGGRRASKIS